MASAGLLCGVVHVILRLAILVELRLVTDGQTDRHRAMASTADAQHRAVKIVPTPLWSVCILSEECHRMTEWCRDVMLTSTVLLWVEMI